MSSILKTKSKHNDDDGDDGGDNDDEKRADRIVESTSEERAIPNNKQDTVIRDNAKGAYLLI
jgi:hypothetical protein